MTRSFFLIADGLLLGLAIWLGAGHACVVLGSGRVLSLCWVGFCPEP